MRRLCLTASLALAMASGFGGCIKTQHDIRAEIAPIKITMDINLKVQKELEDFLDLD
ncbi:MAG: hypothetical protein FWG50_07505 [Kiritimatiellaeota bacterium]|nr:hypothetical protein [Kiritimatiellota bacterium]